MKLTPKEIVLFDHFEVTEPDGGKLEVYPFGWVPLYKATITNWFFEPEKYSKEAVEALRKGFRALCDCTTYRTTDEYEELITW